MTPKTGGSQAKAGAAIAGSFSSLGVSPEVASAGMKIAEQGLAGAAESAAGLLGNQALPKVEYTLTVHDGPDALWQVRGLELAEALSEPYTLNLELVTDELDTDTDAMLGASIELTVERDFLVRHLCGIIYEVDYLGIAFDRLQVRVAVGPALHLLGQRIDTRLWQHATVPAVVKEVLEAALADYGRAVDLDALTASYSPREYIVQYRESDLDFVHRLLEEEGICYWFEHASADGKELLVLSDNADCFVDVETLDGNPELPIIVHEPDNAELESILVFDAQRALTSTAVAQRIFDWQDPHTPLEAVGPAAGEPGADERGLVREVYHHGHFVEADPEPRTLRKLVHLRQRDHLARGRGNVTGLAPGRKFTLCGHARPELDQQYMVRRIVHRGACPEVIQGEAPTDLPRYQNRFECMVFDPTQPYRPPPVTPKPRIHGPQTAIVTGPAGEEIHTDDHGRVKVLFNWDRVHGPRDDSSMWIRVAQPWAGSGFGTFFLPRIGMEVVVEFIEGDPAKPLINGCVYNGANTTSVGPAENKTQSGLRSRSSPNSDGYNELAFEDAAGTEQITLHAQKDFNETIENDHTTTVHNNQTITVDVDQTTTVHNNQTITVDVDQTTTVTGDQTISVTGDRSASVTGNSTLAVMGTRTTTVDGGLYGISVAGDYSLSTTANISATAPDQISLSCGGASITMTPSTITLSVAGSSLTLDGAANLRSEAGSGLRLTGDANLGASTGSSLALTDAVALASDACKSTVSLDDAGAWLGSTVEAGVSAPVAHLVGGEVGCVKAEATGVNVSGPKVDLAAQGLATVSGSMVKIN